MQSFLIASAMKLPRSSLHTAIRAGWVCSSCRRNGAPRPINLPSYRRSFSSSPARRIDVAPKPYYVTTPIFYVNAAPHVGHLYSMVIADVFKRWEVLKGRQAYLCTGTDEHGMKVQRAAELQEVPPKIFCDSNAETFMDLAQKPTYPDHREAVEFFWGRLRERGYIYESKHEGWYCVSDEAFYPENMVEKRVNSMTGKPFIASIETGNEVEWTEERNYHFRLTDLRDRLLQFYKENPQWVVPASRMADVVSWVQNNLEDLSVSRPVSRLNWGIPVPDDPSQTIYVWVDALINYLTKAGYPMWTPGSESALGWPADVHIIGKDIVRFHCVYWPALLLALDLPLPKRVLSHGHWMMDSRKMSKSIGNVVNPFFAIDRWGVDTMRYFMIYNGGISQDSDYDNSFIVERYKRGLQGGVGGLLNRVTRSKAWNVRSIIQQAHEGGYKALDGEFKPMQTEMTELRDTTEGLSRKALDFFEEQLNPGRALKEIMEVVFQANRLLQHTEPWNLVKRGEVEAAHQIIYHAAEALRVCGILLQPFMPEKSAGLLDRLGVDQGQRTFDHARFDSDSAYGISTVPLGEGAQSTVSTSRVLLVPYDAHHVPQYHTWMEDEAIREATASDRLTLQEEYENQVSWRTSADKLTFVLCRPLEPSSPRVKATVAGDAVWAGRDDVPERMLGDINMFLTPWDDEDDDDAAKATKDTPVADDVAGVEFVRAEVDVMIAGAADRGRGLGKAAVGALLEFVSRNREGILREYATTTHQQPQNSTGSSKRPEIREFVVRIKASNAGSIALFKGFGFRQRGEVNYFGEIEMVLLPAIGKLGEGTPSIGEIEVVEGYREAKYDRSRLPKETRKTS
ncbi:methionyl-trna synthetase protein [Apiospora rasikravindrae]|uniref:methionine--tRNA ligase n=1 Tax=Apiospora rasikravindrae TaxID=990691 RepID=A0ABR1RRG5_9PEZI